MKARIKFRKYGALRFIGHLDVMRFFQKVRVIAAVIGYICIKTMLVIVRNRKFRVFAVYCLIVGLLSIGGFFYTL